MILGQDASISDLYLFFPLSYEIFKTLGVCSVGEKWVKSYCSIFVVI
jgi:hypothetical protein